ncbi:MAG: hypothetical protein SGJ04_07080 [Bacteroidota bacterium]|nr:hypothetical protein [Bacteroidota bacterium]
MRLLRLLIYILVFVSSLTGFAAKQTSFVLYVNSSFQDDSLGHNVVKDLTNNSINWVNSSKIKLYNSPEKKFIIKSIIGNEAELNVSTLYKCNAVMLVEDWQAKKKYNSTKLKGIIFIKSDAINPNNDELLGYIDCNQTVLQLLSETRPYENLSGNYNFSLLGVLNLHRFNYDIVTKDNFALKTEKDREKVKKRYYSDFNYDTVINTKLVRYVIKTGVNTGSEFSRDIIFRLQDFFISNPQEFYNIGGDKIMEVSNYPSILISGLVVTEVWQCIDGNPIGYIIRVNIEQAGLELNTISTNQFTEWGVFFYDGKTIEQVIAEKKFRWELKQVNSQALNIYIRERVKDHLNNCNWKALINTTYTIN